MLEVLNAYRSSSLCGKTNSKEMPTLLIFRSKRDCAMNETERRHLIYTLSTEIMGVFKKHDLNDSDYDGVMLNVFLTLLNHIVMCLDGPGFSESKFGKPAKEFLKHFENPGFTKEDLFN
jgi:hypothetical protein